jgi:hypothetical protein
MLVRNLKKIILLPVGYGLRGSPCCQVSGAQTALDADILWANLINSSEFTGLLLAREMDCNFCLAWKIAVAWEWQLGYESYNNS